MPQQRQRRPRRPRFTCTASLHGGSPQALDIVAKDALEAQRTAERNGYSVLSPLVLKRNAVKAAAARRNWVIDQSAMRAGFAAMTDGRDLPRSMHIGYTTHVSHAGRFHLKGDGSLALTVVAAADATSASSTLWHEMAHVWQYVRMSERLGHVIGSPAAAQAFIAAIKAERATRVGYLNRPMEREARTWEALSDTDPLVKVVR